MLPERDGCPWSVSADSFHGNAEFAEVCGPEPAAPTLFLRRQGKPVSYEISDLIPVVAVFQPDLQPAVVGRVPLAPSHLALDYEPSDRKSTRLNSSHANISYAVFCLKKKIRSINLTPQR